jgi:hypothetical protein
MFETFLSTWSLLAIGVAVVGAYLLVKPKHK